MAGSQPIEGQTIKEQRPTAIGFERVLTTREPSLITMLDIEGNLVNGQAVKKVGDDHGCGPAVGWQNMVYLM